MKYGTANPEGSTTMVIKKVVIDKANRLYQWPPEINSFIPSLPKPSLLKKNQPVDLASFSWPVLDKQQFSPPESLQAADQEQINGLKEELAGWFQSYHGVKIDPLKEIYIGGSISSLLFSIALAFVDNGDIAFVPDLGIPLYRRVITACGGEPVTYSITQKNDWLPDFERIHTSLGRIAGVLFLNSPHNPTGAELREKDLVDLIWLAGRENIMVVNDAAYGAVSDRKHTSLTVSYTHLTLPTN